MFSDRLARWFEKILTKHKIRIEPKWFAHVPRKTVKVTIPPSPKIVLIMYFGTLFLIAFIILEVLYMAIFHEFNSEIFSAITGLMGTIMGTYIGAKT